MRYTGEPRISAAISASVQRRDRSLASSTLTRSTSRRREYVAPLRARRARTDGARDQRERQGFRFQRFDAADAQRMIEQHHQRLRARVDAQVLLVEGQWFTGAPAVTSARARASIGCARLTTRLVSPPLTGWLTW